MLNKRVVVQVLFIAILMSFFTYGVSAAPEISIEQALPDDIYLNNPNPDTYELIAMSRKNDE